MTNGIEATVALCKCGKVHKAYGVRFEKAGKKHWKYTWAFPIKESAANMKATMKPQLLVRLSQQKIIPDVLTVKQLPS